jgi:hypothetical protein
MLWRLTGIAIPYAIGVRHAAEAALPSAGKPQNDPQKNAE